MQQTNMKEGEMGDQESFPMTGGDGEYSYTKNSSPQKRAADRAKPMLAEAIGENLDIVPGSPTKSISIADLGCSVGNNTFIAVKNIIEAIQEKYQKQGHTSSPLEFQVFFSDHASNDFNLLFLSLPTDRQYFVCGVPGSFYTRLFPKASLNVIHCSSALHWLSKVPPELGDLKSPCCNREKIFYANAPKEIGEAYAAQYERDMETFLGARAQELAPGGLMVLLISGRISGTLPGKSSLGPQFEPLESSLVDMANEGIISKDKLALFNLPMYSPSPEEIEKIIERNGNYIAKKIEKMPDRTFGLFKKQECRAGFEALIKAHFGSEILDELFDRYEAKVTGRPPPGVAEGIGMGIFILLKRKQ
ncbi:loganic acid O-methyltransferase-like [Cornus florida]|uniref:loganic acid O-methyltransferase-like n=1 Tax=Cornus florida TaxID=4283 RepID=UPI00289F3882|nr:loganic acid O-methyltransferase-like [Cornus florida]